MKWSLLLLTSFFLKLEDHLASHILVDALLMELLEACRIAAANQLFVDVLDDLLAESAQLLGECFSRMLFTIDFVLSVGCSSRR